MEDFEEGQQFADFLEFSQYLERFEERNSIKYYRRDSRTIENAQKRLPKRKLKDELKFYEITGRSSPIQWRTEATDWGY